MNVLLVLLLPAAAGQDGFTGGAAALSGGVVGGFLAGALLVIAAWYMWKLYLRRKHGKHLVLSTDPENAKGEFAFDNAAYQDECARTGWRHVGCARTSGDDELHTENMQAARKVQLWAKDFAGLGFTVDCGAREGVRVHSVLRNGPASAAGVQPGEKIHSIKMDLRRCVLADAAQLLALASPYPVELELERGGRHLHPSLSPNDSTFENKAKGIKKIIMEKNIATRTLERFRKDQTVTLEQENEKKEKKVKNTYSEPEIRRWTGADIQQENSAKTAERVHLQKKRSDRKTDMKFGIRVLPPNVSDDCITKKSVENVDILTRSVDDLDKAEARMRYESETERVDKPVVAKRREKTAPPVPNARHIRSVVTDYENSANTSKLSEQSTAAIFLRDDLNSSGIRRDEKGIPQELPQHMLEAAIYARSNRKSVPDLDERENDKPKKVKAKAPMPPQERKKRDESIAEQVKEVDIFLNTEKLHSSVLNHATDMSYYTLIPKIRKVMSNADSMNYNELNDEQDDIDEIIPKPVKHKSESLNNFCEDRISNLSFDPDMYSVVSLNNSDKESTTMELNNSDITIHRSPNNETIQSKSDDTSVLNDESERKAASLGDLSRVECRKIRNMFQGTLERAQSLDISADGEGVVKSPKRIAQSVVERNFNVCFNDSFNVENLPELIKFKTMVIKSKDPGLSLKSPATEGLSIFQLSSLKKASEFGNLEDAIVKGSNRSIESGKEEIGLKKRKDCTIPELDLSGIGQDENEASDKMAKKIIDENIKVHLKLEPEFAKSTSDGSNCSSLVYNPKSDLLYTAHSVSTDFENSLSLSYDTNIPDDIKMSRHSFGNSLERPKSDMMKKLLAINPMLNVKTDQTRDEQNATHTSKPDVVNFNMKVNDGVDDFVSNIKIGSNNSLTYNKGDFDYLWSQRQNIENRNNVVTITTSRPEAATKREANHMKSIEIGESQSIPDVIEGITQIKHEDSSRTYVTKDLVADYVSKENPEHKKITVTENELDNKIITQNLEQIPNKYLTENEKEAPLHVEQVTFGVIRNLKDIETATEKAIYIKDIDNKTLEEIKKQTPGLHFTSYEPAYSKKDTMILNKNVNELDVLAQMDKLKTDPTFLSQKTSEELSQMGVRIIHDLEDQNKEDSHRVDVTKTSCLINPKNFFLEQRSDDQSCKGNNVTEIQVVTDREKANKADIKKSDKPKSGHSSSLETDKTLLHDFISYERCYSALEATAQSMAKPKERNSDFDLPRTTEIKFKTSTYESPKCAIVTSTDIKQKRLSERDKDSGTKPALSAKPTSIPVKTTDKFQKPVTNPSKIPVIMSQKSQVQDNLSNKGLTLPRSPLTASSSSENISVTSIKSSSRNPSGK